MLLLLLLLLLFVLFLLTVVGLLLQKEEQSRFAKQVSSKREHRLFDIYVATTCFLSLFAGIQRLWGMREGTLSLNPISLCQLLI